MINRPWMKLRPDFDWRVPHVFASGLAVFQAALERSPDGTAVDYFGREMSYAQIDAMSGRLAQRLIARGFAQGDRLAAMMQNIPEFVIAMIAAWKAGGAFLPISPMNTARELSIILNDARPSALIIERANHSASYQKMERSVWRPTTLFLADAFSHPGAEVAVPAAPAELVPESLLELISAEHGDALVQLDGGSIDPQDDALLVYTSGTTGVPKAAVISHSATGIGASYGADIYGLANGDTVLALAPVFHMTGLMTTVMTSLFLSGKLVMAYRFNPATYIDVIARTKPAFTAGPPTAFMALMQAGGDLATLGCFKSIGLGGAPVPPTILGEIKAAFGIAAQTGYGMTETGGATILTPIELRDITPVDPQSGALAIGIPCAGVDAWILNDDGTRAGPREIGEIVLQTPTNMNRYWNRTEQTGETLRPDGLRSGDVGFYDEDGWFYLVDRKKDVIIAGGYKVWPREVEDVIYASGQVLEVAVIGIQDPYRGEMIQALVVPRSGTVDTDELLRFCRANLSAYKVPREIEVVERLEKTVSGKIRRVAV